MIALENFSSQLFQMETNNLNSYSLDNRKQNNRETKTRRAKTIIVMGHPTKYKYYPNIERRC